jgi:hypothetical protein
MEPIIYSTKVVYILVFFQWDVELETTWKRKKEDKKSAKSEDEMSVSSYILIEQAPLKKN